MRTKFIFLVIAIIVVLISTSAIAQDRVGGAILFDQDFIGLRTNKDMNYTMGLGLAAYGKFTNSNLFLVPWVRKRADDVIQSLFPSILDSTVIYSFQVGISAFTPENLATEDVLPLDRPYGCLLNFTSRQIAVDYLGKNRKHPIAYQSEINIGILGTNIGKEAQTFIHKRQDIFPTTRPIPIGWHNQISHGGEPTFMYSFNADYLVLEDQNSQAEKRKHQHIQTIVHSGIMLGYYTNAYAGATVRLGVFKIPFWSSTTNGLANHSQLFSLGNESSGSRMGRLLRRSGIFIFGSLRGRAVLYNALLNGQFKKSPHVFGFEETKHFIAEYDLGIALNFSNLRFTYTAISSRTAEFISPLSRSHNWGQLTISWVGEY